MSSSDLAALATAATAFVGNDRFGCRLARLDLEGACVIPSVRAQPGTFVRLNLALQGIEEVVDIDALIVRETRLDESYAWDLRFLEPPPHIVEAIGTFLRGRKPQELHRLDASATPPVPYERLARKVGRTGPYPQLAGRMAEQKTALPIRKALPAQSEVTPRPENLTQSAPPQAPPPIEAPPAEDTHTGEDAR